MIIIAFIGCGGGSSSSTATTKPIINTASFSLTLERISDNISFDDIKVIIKIEGTSSSTNINQINFTTSKGTKSSLTFINNNEYSFLINTSSTGEHKIEVTIDNITKSKIALVLKGTNSDWGQAQSVEGFVNTQGYEDGITITPDGEYLFVQYGPYRWSSLLFGCIPSSNTCTHSWTNTIIGDISSPKRPGFYTSRFNGTTQKHNLNSWNIGDNQAPFYPLTTMFYGFKKQEDGSFKEPFFLAFEDEGDGIIGPYGLSFMKLSDNTYRTIFSLKDSFTSNESATSAVSKKSFDIYSFDATFNQNNILGVYTKQNVVGPPLRSTTFPSTKVDFGSSADSNYGTQGNPFIYYENSLVKSIWTDDEHDKNDSSSDNDLDGDKISVYLKNSGTFPSTSDWEKIILPSDVNIPSKETLQPTFINNKLYFTQDFNIKNSIFSGDHLSTHLSNNSYWSDASIIIEKETVDILNATDSDIGKIVSLGEPTIAIINGKEVLYFMYAYIRGVDATTNNADLDFQAGFIKNK